MQTTTNSHGVNTAIMFHDIGEEGMRSIGFRTFESRGVEYWSYSRMFRGEICFWVHFPVGSDEQDDLRIDVIDDEFGQPYDYQYILSRNKSHAFALEVRGRVEEEMQKLQDAGVLSGHVDGDYI